MSEEASVLSGAARTPGMLQGGELVLKCLQAEGNRHIFGVADVSYNPIMRECGKYGQSFIGPRHESAGVHMADATARVTGRPGVVIAGMGPGVANMLPGVVCADIEGIPVIVLATQRTTKTHSAVKRGRFQYTPQFDLFRPCVKFAKLVDDAHRIPETLREAYRVALQGRPGPVYIEIPMDVMVQEVDPANVSFPAPDMYRVPPQAGDADAVARAAEALITAENPMILAGNGIYRARAQEQFTEFAKRHNIPVITSLGARGVIPEDELLSLQMLTPAGVTAIRDSDAVLVLGSAIGEPLEFGRGGGMWGDADEKTWIQVDADPGAIGCNRPIDIGIVGDVRRVMTQLDDAIAAKGGRTKPNGLEEMCRQHKQILQMMREEVLGNDSAPVNPGRMVAEVRDFFPKESIVCYDGGNTTLWNMHYNHIYGGDFLWTSKFGHLGTGMPYAMGAKLANPDKPVYLVSGDGAIGFNIQELETCVRHGINIVVVVNCDYQWGMEVPGQSVDFGGREKCVGVDHSPARYDKVAEGFGCHGEYVTDPKELRGALERAVESGKPALVQVIADRAANVFPPGLELLATTYGDNY